MGFNAALFANKWLNVDYSHHKDVRLHAWWMRQTL